MEIIMMVTYSRMAFMAIVMVFVQCIVHKNKPEESDHYRRQ